MSATAQLDEQIGEKRINNKVACFLMGFCPSEISRQEDDGRLGWESGSLFVCLTLQSCQLFRKDIILCYKRSTVFSFSHLSHTTDFDLPG